MFIRLAARQCRYFGCVCGGHRQRGPRFCRNSFRAGNTSAGVNSLRLLKELNTQTVLNDALLGAMGGR